MQQFLLLLFFIFYPECSVFHFFFSDKAWLTSVKAFFMAAVGALPNATVAPVIGTYIYGEIDVSSGTAFVETLRS